MQHKWSVSALLFSVSFLALTSNLLLWSKLLWRPGLQSCVCLHTPPFFCLTDVVHWGSRWPCCSDLQGLLLSTSSCSGVLTGRVILDQHLRYGSERLFRNDVWWPLRSWGLWTSLQRASEAYEKRISTRGIPGVREA